jgi:hypothetical protein
MKLLLQTWATNFLRWCRAAAQGWDRFWFTPVDPATLGFVRIMAASILLYIHLACLPQFLDLVGPNAWIDQQAVRELTKVPDDPLYQAKEGDSEALRWEKFQVRVGATWYRLSIWLWVQDPTLMWIIQGIFLACMVCYLVGFCSRPMAVICWFAHLSYVTRGYTIWFGMDVFLLFIMFYLMFAPTGAALSVDRLLARYRALKKTGKLKTALEPEPSWGANVALRMIQIHMGIAYLCSALTKLQGPAWWNGLATWIPMNTSEFALVDMRWLGQTDWQWQWMCSLTTLATIAFELVFIFLVWLKWWRPLILAGAVMLHGGIGLFMGLFGFGVVMMTGCSSFFFPSEIRWFFQVLFRGPDGYRFIFDRQNNAQNRLARLIATFDVWQQVELIDTQETKNPPAAAGTLLLPDGKPQQGMAIFGKLVGPLRTLWLAWPVAYWFFKTEISAVQITTAKTGAHEEQPLKMKKAV